MITVIVWAAESVFQYLYSVSWRNLAQTLQHELRMDADGHVQGWRWPISRTAARAG